MAFEVDAGSIGLIAVTGSSGKTTVCHLIEAVLQDGRPPGALLSDEAERIGERAVTIDQPSGPRLELDQFLRDAIAMGAPWAVVERGAERPHAIDITVITTGSAADLAQPVRSLTPEPGAGRPQAIVLNRDDPALMALKAERHLPVLTFGLHSEADVRATAVETSLEGSKFQLHLPGAEPQPCHLQLLGPQNVANALAAAAVGHLLGLSPATIARALFRCPGLPGRMEHVEAGQRFHLILDRADTPERLVYLERFRPPGIERVALLGGGSEAAFQTAVAQARHGDLLILCGPRPDFDPRAVIREVLGDGPV